MVSKFLNINGVFLLIITIGLLMTSCDHDRKPKKVIKPSDLKEPLIEANKHVVRTEAQQIDDFLRRYKWPVNETGSGLRYYIYRQGDGNMIKEGDKVVLEYSVLLITGEQVYHSSQRGPLYFTAGKGDVISGLEEGILLLREGDQAKFIIPSHLGYGLLGDEEKIPPKSTLIYDVEVKEVN